MKALMHRIGSTGRRSLVAAAVAALAVVVGLGVAVAYWLSTDSSNYAAAAADSLNAGSQPTVSGVNGQDVTIRWSATSTAGNRSATGYSVVRYPSASGGTAVAAGGGCSGTLAAVLTCTEPSVPSGTWYYAITPHLANWVGGEGARSAVVTVSSSTFSVAAGQNVRPPATLSGGTLAHFKSNESVAFHLDTAGGTALSASINAVDGSGQASGFTVSIPAGVSDGSHVAVAVGGSGSAATSNSFMADSTAPTATLTFPGNGTAYSASAYNAGCTPVGLCGSVSDATAVQSVTVSVRQGSGNYWNGSAFAGTSETFVGATLASPASASTTWTYGLPLPSDGAYTVHVRTQDTLGNTQTSTYAATAGFTIDTTSPTVTVASVNGTVVVFPYATNADITTVGGTCGAAGGDAATVSVSVTGQATQSGSATCSGGSWTYTLSASLATEGAYTVAATQVDSVGNTGTSGAKSMTVDKTKPVVSVSSVNGNNVLFPYSTNATITSVGGSCGRVAGDSSSVSVTITGPDARSGTATCSSSTGTWTFAPSAMTTEGTYTIVATQVDAAGNTGSSGSQAVILDRTAPSVTLTSLNGATRAFPYSTNATVTTVGGACGIAAGDNSSVTVSVTGAATQSAAVACASGSWTYTLAPSLSTDGGYSITATQTDLAGNTGTSGAKSVTVDKTAPVVTVSSVNGATRTFPYSTNATVTSVGGACGAASGDSSTVSVSITGTTTESGAATCSGGTWAWTLTTSLSADGSYAVSAAQSDAAGNTGTAPTQTVIVDKTAPAVTLTSVNGSAATFPYFTRSSVTSVSGACGNATGDSSSVTLSITGGATESGTVTCAAGSWSWTLPTALSAQGNYTVSVTQVDTAGNSGTASQAITIDTTAPTAVDIQTTSGGSAGTPSAGDAFVFTFSEQIAPTSVKSGWDGSATSVTVSFSGGSGNSDDTATFTAAALGTVDLGTKNGYVKSGNGNYTFSASMTLSNAGGHSVVTVTLSGPPNGGQPQQLTSGTTLKWTPTSSITDLAGNACSTSPATQSGGAKENF